MVIRYYYLSMQRFKPVDDTLGPDLSSDLGDMILFKNGVDLR